MAAWPNDYIKWAGEKPPEGNYARDVRRCDKKLFETPHQMDLLPQHAAAILPPPKKSIQPTPRSRSRVFPLSFVVLLSCVLLLHYIRTAPLHSRRSTNRTVDRSRFFHSLPGHLQTLPPRFLTRAWGGAPRAHTRARAHTHTHTHTETETSKQQLQTFFQLRCIQACMQNTNDRDPKDKMRFLSPLCTHTKTAAAAAAGQGSATSLHR